MLPVVFDEPWWKSSFNNHLMRVYIVYTIYFICGTMRRDRRVEYVVDYVSSIMCGIYWTIISLNTRKTSNYSLFACFAVKYNSLLPIISLIEIINDSNRDCYHFRLSFTMRKLDFKLFLILILLFWKIDGCPVMGSSVACLPWFGNSKFEIYIFCLFIILFFRWCSAPEWDNYINNYFKN